MVHVREERKKKDKALILAAVDEIGWEFAYSRFDNPVELYQRSIQRFLPKAPPPGIWEEFNYNNFTKVRTYAGLGWVCEW